jgi:hypothetical protein
LDHDGRQSGIVRPWISSCIYLMTAPLGNDCDAFPVSA